MQHCCTSHAIFLIQAGFDTGGTGAKTAHPSDSFNSSSSKDENFEGRVGSFAIAMRREGFSMLGNISGALVRFIVWLLAGKLFVSKCPVTVTYIRGGFSSTVLKGMTGRG